MKFTAIALASFATLFCNGQARAESCTLDYTKLKSAVDVSSRLVRSKGSVHKNREERSISQTVVLKNGLKVKYTAGGCEHYSYGFIFSKVTLPTDAAGAFTRATDLLNETPVTEKAMAQKQALLDGLASASQNLPEGDENGFYFSCGEASCGVLKGPQADSLEVNYSFAL